MYKLTNIYEQMKEKEKRKEKKMKKDKFKLKKRKNVFVFLGKPQKKCVPIGISSRKKIKIRVYIVNFQIITKQNYKLFVFFSSGPLMNTGFDFREKFKITKQIIYEVEVLESTIIIRKV